MPMLIYVKCMSVYRQNTDLLSSALWSLLDILMPCRGVTWHDVVSVSSFGSALDCLNFVSQPGPLTHPYLALHAYDIILNQYTLVPCTVTHPTVKERAVLSHLTNVFLQA